ncbi:hypothetical protein Dimus_015532, partial [Dionaea muscipula]
MVQTAADIQRAKDNEFIYNKASLHSHFDIFSSLSLGHKQQLLQQKERLAFMPSFHYWIWMMDLVGEAPDGESVLVSQIKGVGQHCHRDEDGEPLIDYDDMQSDEEQPRDDVVDYNDLQVDNYNDGCCGDWRELRSPTPIYNGAEGSDPRSKGRKRLVKKSNKSSGIPPELNDFEDDDVGVGGFGGDPAWLVRDESDEGPYSSGLLKRKIKGVKDGSEKRRKEKKMRRDKDGGNGGKDMPKLTVKRRKGEDDGDLEMKELSDTIAGGDSEDDREGVRTGYDDNFIDDSGVDPVNRYGSDNEAASLSHYAQAEEGEEDDEIKELFSMGKKKKKNEKSVAEIAYLVENLIAELDAAIETDAILNSQGRPAINKLKKLPLLNEALS